MSAHYLLSDEASRLATEKGTANPKWFRPAVDPEKIRDLMQKSDARAMRDTALWLGAMCVAAGCAIAL